MPGAAGQRVQPCDMGPGLRPTAVLRAGGLGPLQGRVGILGP